MVEPVSGRLLFVLATTSAGAANSEIADRNDLLATSYLFRNEPPHGYP
jgi:hypothetical protein